MLIIRREQLHALAVPGRERFVDAMCRHLQTYFADHVRGLDTAELRAHVSRTIDRAATYGLTSRRDCCRFLNLAATFGWEFDAAPQHAWMKQCLEDPSVSSAGNRLAVLVDRCAHRLEVEEHNRALRARFAEASPAAAAGKPDDPDEPAHFDAVALAEHPNSSAGTGDDAIPDKDALVERTWDFLWGDDDDDDDSFIVDTQGKTR